ncbi:MAG: hypothetical protein A2170_11050 [Deltaproteobacteria bacterium RBG_13_53_10]|nr:MAG: hypothetical protein A2170_11050 [Deltaproteobacteria bacterium RBG_13_53_10]
MVRRFFLIGGIILLGFSLAGCPKRIPESMIIERLPVENPMARLLGAFSAAESLQARASIRIDTVRSGEQMNFPLNGFILFQKPDLLRILGYHPLGVGLFDALYRNGEFLILIPPQKKAYIGEASQLEGLLEEAGTIQISVEKRGGSEIPTRIWIEVEEKRTRIDIRLKDVVLNPQLPEDSFQWVVPEGVDVRPITRLLRGKRLE